jgi:hypothetical protein
MREALTEAEATGEAGQLPIGAVLVLDALLSDSTIGLGPLQARFRRGTAVGVLNF